MVVMTVAPTASSFTIYLVQGDRGGEAERRGSGGRKGVRTSKLRAETRIQ